MSVWAAPGSTLKELIALPTPADLLALFKEKGP